MSPVLSVMMLPLPPSSRDNSRTRSATGTLWPVSWPPLKAHHARSCGCAVGAFDSVGVSVARFCLLKFGTVLRDHQLIHWKMLGFTVERQTETIPPKLLKQVLPLKQALILAKLLQRIEYRFVYLRFNIESFGVEPVRCSRDLIVS